MLLESIETKLEKLQSSTFIVLFGVVILGLLVRIYFTPWHLPSNSPDAFVFLIEGLAYANGDFSYFSIRFLWPAFLSLFFAIFKFDDYFGYMTLMRIVSISISAVTAPVVYLVSKQFVEKKYAIFAATLFTIEANLVENSIFAITEPIFILLGLVSFYFAIQKNEKYIPLAFLFAGLSFDTRLNGIVLFLLLLLTCSMRIRPKVRLVKFLMAGILIFLAVGSPHIFVTLNQGEVPFLNNFTGVTTIISEKTVLASTYNPSETPSPFNMLKNALKNEFLHVFRISVPFLAILVPFGLVVALKSLDFQKKIMFATIIISLVIAVPQYTISAEYRNLFFITPFFCVLSAIGIQKIVSNTELKNIFLILVIAGLLLISYNFLRERYDIDEELVLEKDNLGKYIANNLHGRIMGDLRLETMRNMPEIKFGHVDGASAAFNQQIAVLTPGITFDTITKLMPYMTEKKVDYLILDDKPDGHFPIFESIFYAEKDFPYLEKVYDSYDNNYKKLKVKIFKINYDEYEKISQ